MALSTSDKQYYESPERWGEHYSSNLQQIIDNIQLLADDDSYFKKAKRFRMSIIGKQCMKELKLGVQQDKRIISFELGPEKTFPFPRFMTIWHRISYVNECGKIQEVDINNKGSVSELLQDEKTRILYDEVGNVLEGDTDNYEEGMCLEFITCENNKLFKNPEPKKYWAREITTARYFEFSDDLVGKEIVIEYLSAGLESTDDSKIIIHQALVETVSNYIKWKLLEGKRNVPNSEVMYYYQLYLKEKKKSRKFLSQRITIDQILKSVSIRYNG